MIKNERYFKSVKRNLREVVNALHERQVLILMDEYIGKHGTIYYSGGSFFDVSIKALFNDMVAHIVKVLEDNQRSASFWYILRLNEDRIKAYKSYSADKIKFLKDLAPKLKIVRNKTHFHIDRDGVLDPQAVWSKAGITGNELGKGIDYLFDLLLELNNNVFQEKLSRNNFIYTGKDFSKLLELARSNNLLSGDGEFD